MNRQALTALPRYAPLALTVLLAMTAACGRGSTIRGQALPIPTLTANPPAYTHDPNLLLQGSRPQGTDVLAEMTDGTIQTLAKASGDDAKWSGVLTLTNGSNTFKLFAQRPTGESPRSIPYSVLLTKLQTPTLNNILIDGHVYVYMGDHPSSTVNGPLSGGKSPDGDLEITYNGVSSVAAPIDNNAVWNANVVVSHSDSSAQVVSKDSAGDVSGTLSFEVTGTYQPGPVIDHNSYTANTTRVQQTLYGTKPANSDLYMIINGGTPIRITAASDTTGHGATTWTIPTFNLQEGLNVVAVFVYGTQDTFPSAPDVAYITLSTKVQPPVFNPPLSSFTTDASSITLSGTVGANAYVCVSYVPWTDPLNPPPCIAYSNTTGATGGSFTVVVPLQDANDRANATPPVSNPNGTNNLYITARDAAGNVSPEQSTTIYRVSPPTLSVSFAGGVVTNPNLVINFDAGPYPDDASVQGAGIQQVSVCIDVTNCENIPVNPNGLYSFNSDPNILLNAANQSSHTVTVSVTDQQGATTVTTIPFVYSNGAPLWLSADNGTPLEMGATPRPASEAKSVMDGSGNLHVVWQDTCANLGSSCQVPQGTNQIPPDIFYVKRGSNGAFGTIINVSISDANNLSDGASGNPAVAVDSTGLVHVVWEDTGSGYNPGGTSGGRVLVHRTISGTTLSKPDVVSTIPALVEDTLPALTADVSSGVVHLAYTHGAPNNHNSLIYYQALSGSTWSAPLTVNDAVSNPNLASPDRAAIAAFTGNKVQIAWQDCLVYDPNNGGANECAAGLTLNHDIYTRQVLNATTPGSGVVLVTDKSKATQSDGDSLAPSVVVDPNNQVWVFFSDTGTAGTGSGTGTGRAASGSNIFYRMLGNNVLIDNTYELVSNDPNQFRATSPSASLAPGSNGTIAVVWSALTDATSTASSNIYGASAPYTVTLQGASELLANTPSTSSAPWVSVDLQGGKHVVWADASAPASNAPNPDNVFQVLYDFYP